MLPGFYVTKSRFYCNFELLIYGYIETMMYSEVILN